MGQTKLIIELLSIDIDNAGNPMRFGQLRYRYAHQMTWSEIPVSISPILFSRMYGKGRKHDDLFPTNSYIGQAYCAERTVTKPDRKVKASDRIAEYNICPFNLVFFQPGKGSDIPANCLLEGVDEAYNPPIYDEISDHIIGYEKNIKRLGDWVRHEVNTSVAMLTDNLKAKIIPITSDNVKHYSVTGSR